MPQRNCTYWKILCYSFLGFLCASILVASIGVDYEELLREEHVRFRAGFPSQTNWQESPFGKLKCYLFNVTNAAEFLSGVDKKIKVEEVGPITYSIVGKNEVLQQSESKITYRKVRHHQVKFDPDSSCDPNILNKTVILPNLVLLSAAAKLHDWVPLVRPSFNLITINEPIFINETVHYFLWDFTTPALKMLASYIPNIEANCGLLHNALREKEEVYSAKIGLGEEGIQNFFRLNTFNRYEYFPEQSPRYQISDVYCPIRIRGSFDNSLFPPDISKSSNITIVAIESCRTHRLRYNGTQEFMGFETYKFVLDDLQDRPTCLDSAMGIPLPRGFFDVSPCLFNEVPSAFSPPHFYGTSYNWTDHFEGFTPNANDHEAFIYIQPKVGIPLDVRYRFQSNIPMPDMKGFNKDLQRFSKMMIPTFWFEYDLDDLPPMVLYLMKLNTSYIQVFQPIFMVLLLITTGVCIYKIYMLLKAKKNNS